jgi:RimJ/RimL family protein N-acetyltransferase
MNAVDPDAVELRPLAAGDSDSVVAVFDGMGARSRELRFLLPKPRLSGADVRQLVDVDQHDHVALVASTVTGRRPVALARFVRDRADPGSAEIAVEVVDDWQRRGLGTRMLRALVRRARELDVRRFTMYVSRDNGAVLGMLQHCQGIVTCLESDRGILQYALSLEEAPR